MRKAISLMFIAVMAFSLSACKPSDEEAIRVEQDEVEHEIEVDRKNGVGNTWEIEVPKFND